MRVFISMLVALSLGMGAGDALAAKKKKKKKKKNKEAAGYVMPYGMAGCGLGQMVIKDNNIMQIFAATTNGTSGNQTFGISTGTSGCKPSDKMVATEQKVFVEANLASLTREAAQGTGDHLTAFASLLGCDQSEVAKVSRERYDFLYSEQQADAVLEKYRGALQGTCERV